MQVYATAETALSLDELGKLLAYEPITGMFTWRVARNSRGGRVKPGALAGTLDRYGYRVVVINQLKYSAHRLAWYLYYGEWPTAQIDHINMDITDNRIVNLRLAAMWQQRANQKVRRDNGIRLKGVRRKGARFVARITKRGHCYHLGTFDTLTAAAVAYEWAAIDLYGEFAHTETIRFVPV